ncbi:hypothetical protein F5B21DRAFT_498968 [Xylaria acuta]|nr:hypothetical protein F5B21DRAFT_498968 [Xylaria acuta]
MRVLPLTAAGIALLSGIVTTAANSAPNDGLGHARDGHSPRHEEQDMLHGSPHPFPHIPGPIPVHGVVCTGSKLDRNDMNTAYAKNVAYYNTSAMGPSSVRVFQYQTSMWGICNCKRDIAVGCPQDEIRHADQLITSQCGEDYSGRVWSKKWMKQYVRELNSVLALADSCAICPRNCCRLL